jgi:hypothetical protein
VQIGKGRLACRLGRGRCATGGGKGGVPWLAAGLNREVGAAAIKNVGACTAAIQSSSFRCGVRPRTGASGRRGGHGRLRWGVRGGAAAVGTDCGGESLAAADMKLSEPRGRGRLLWGVDGGGCGGLVGSPSTGNE